MTLEQLKKEAEGLSFEDKGHLAAYLIFLKSREDPEYAEMRDRLDDKDPTHWLSLDEFEARLDGNK